MPKRSAEYMAAQRDRILEAAIACFADKGFHATSTDDIARAAGCGKSGIYAHFRSKKAMIEALTERESTRFEQAVPREIPAFSEAISRSWAALGTTQGQLMSKLGFRLATESLSNPVLQDWYASVGRRYLAWIEAAVASNPAATGLSAGQIKDAARRLLYYWGGMGLYNLLMPSIGKSSLQRDLEAIVPIVLASVQSGAARPSAPARRPAPRRPISKARS